MNGMRRATKPRAPDARAPELVFVVDVSAFTPKGFVGTSSYGEGEISLQFDDGGDGVTLTRQMANQLEVARGSRVSIVVEDDVVERMSSTVTSIGKSPVISDPGVYYSVGRAGGAIVRLAKG
jgi:hypothetical protein